MRGRGTFWQWMVVIGIAAAPPTQAASDPCARGRLGLLALDLFEPASATERRAAVEGLAECEGPKAVGLLEQALLHDKDPEVRVAAARALTDNGSPQAESALRTALREGVPVKVRLQIEQGLARRTPPPPAPEPENDFASPFAVRPQPPAPEPGPVATLPAAPEPGPIAALPTPPKAPVPAPLAVLPPVVKPAPHIPFEKQDGLPLAVVTSALSGASLFPYLAALAQQKNPLTLTLTGTAGAIIGGGSAWGLSLFGMRPTLPQAVWYTNSSAWGTLAGLALHSGLVRGGGGSEVDQDRALWALLAAGQTAGMAAGVWSARNFDWNARQVVLADGLLIGSYLGYGGLRLLQNESVDVNGPMAIATVPLMVGSAIAARYVNPSGKDLHLVSAASLASGWSGFLLAHAAADRTTAERQGLGGLLLGSSVGFLGSMAGAALVETDPRAVWGATALLAAGNVFGLGTNMVLSPLDERGEVNVRHWALGTALGGLAFGAGAYALWPHLELGPSTPGMTSMGVAYGSLTWLLATSAADTGVRRPEDFPLVLGGALAGGVAMGTAGLIASRWFSPTPFDHLMVGSGTALGISAGLGSARLLSADPSQRGLPDLVGVLGGSALGLGVTAALQHHSPLRPTDFGAELSGAALGALSGALIPTAGNADWMTDGPGQARQSRVIGAGTMVGAAVGGTAAIAASHLMNARPGQVLVPTVAATLGVGMGAGLGLALAPETSQPARVGMLAGSTLMAAAALASEPYLKLSHGLGSSAAEWGLVGTGLGVGYGLVVSEFAQTPDGIGRMGGVLFGASTGLATGLVSSQFVGDARGAWLTTSAGTVLGGMLGRGTALLIPAQEDPLQDRRMLAAGTLLGAAAGTVVSAFQNSLAPLGGTDALAAGVGGGYGLMVGLLAPGINDPQWNSDPRAKGGGALVGLSAGAITAALARRATGAAPGQVVLPSVAATLGVGMGAGLGLALAPQESLPARIGMLTGSTLMAAAALASDPYLKLSQGLGPSATEWGVVGTGLGVGYGLVVSELAQEPNGTGAMGGVLFGASTGLASGLVTSRFAGETRGAWITTGAATVLGGLLGRGTGLLVPPLADPVQDRRMLALGTLVGAAAGTVGSGLQNSLAPLQPTDAVAAGVGGGYGLLVGLLAPTLGDPRFSTGRATSGGAMVGASAGAISAALLRRGTGATSGEVLVTGLGGLDGAALGLGVGLLLGDEDSQSARIGMVSGALGGLAIGATAWRGLELTGPKLSLVRTATVVSTWSGLWLPTLGEARLGEGPASQLLGQRMLGGVLTGFGVGTFASSLAAPYLDLDEDLLNDALALYVLGTGAGAGAGALFSTRHDAVTGAMLGVGTAGLIAGGLLHDRIDFGRRGHLMVALGAEGAWLGGWASVLLSSSPDDQPLINGVTGRALVGGLSAGALAGVGAAALLGELAPLEPKKIGVALTTSALGASLVGGLSLLTPALNNRTGVGLMMGASAAGFAGGAYFADQLEFSSRTLPYALLGGALGVAEGNAFAWASESDDPRVYAGASLIGASVGTALGLSASAAAGTAASDAPAAMGFAAWGAWIGSFSGALAFRDGAPELHRVSLGGLIGANAGFGIGFGLMKLGWIESRDIGWLSLFGGVGTLVGAGVTAPFSSGENPAPILAGLAVGPLVGMVAGGFIWPRIRGAQPSEPVASVQWEAWQLPDLTRLLGVKDWQPVFSMLPPPSGVGEGAMMIGAQGTLW
ncbi:MAG: HEAT repeat domain-containing protein [Myxococcota bacterium]|nr:HEAT repeat domain-containing protein [Myxococcota bacterium]